MKNYILKDRKLSIISRLSIILIWIILAKLVHNEVILPSITSTVTSMIKIIKGPGFWTIINHTLFRTLTGFLVSLVIALVTGILSGASKIVYNLMLPILNFLNSIPTIAIIVLALIWLGNEIVPMFVGFVMVFPILYETILNSILNIDQDIIQMARLYKVGKIKILRSIYIPNILYNLSTVFNTVLGINLKMVVAGEVLAQPKYAIGSNLQLQRMYLNTSGVFAWIIIILLISGAFSYIGKGIKYSLRLNRWK